MGKSKKIKPSKEPRNQAGLADQIEQVSSLTDAQCFLYLDDRRTISVLIFLNAIYAKIFLLYLSCHIHQKMPKTTKIKYAKKISILFHLLVLYKVGEVGYYFWQKLQNLEIFLKYKNRLFLGQRCFFW